MSDPTDQAHPRAAGAPPPRRLPFLAVEAAARIAVGVVLLAATAAKVRLRHELPDLVGAYGVPTRLRAAAAVLLVLVEAGVGVLLVGGVAERAASYAALALGVAFVGAALTARLRGARRVRCGCFGARERPWLVVLGRAAAFTVLAGVAVVATERGLPRPSSDFVVFAVLGVLAVAVAVLALLVLALYRQVGVLALRISPRVPLELAEEGPPVGADGPSLPALERRGSELVAFFSEDCRLCRELAPAVRALPHDGVRTRVVYEAAEPDVFARWNVPGTPFAVHLVDGVVAAKGLANTPEQLDALVSLGAVRRRNAAA